MNADGTVGFDVGSHDPELPLVIDPTFMAADADTATSTSLTLATPVGANTGDVLVAAITDGSAQTISAPAGWVTIRSDTRRHDPPNHLLPGGDRIRTGDAHLHHRRFVVEVRCRTGL